MNYLNTLNYFVTEKKNIFYTYIYYITTYIYAMRTYIYIYIYRSSPRQSLNDFFLFSLYYTRLCLSSFVWILRRVVQF